MKTKLDYAAYVDYMILNELPFVIVGGRQITYQEACEKALKQMGIKKSDIKHMLNEVSNDPILND